MDETYNVASALRFMARQAPFQPAVLLPSGRGRDGRTRYIQLTFKQLEEESNRYAWGISRLGIHQRDRVLLLVKPGVELIAVAFALIKMGAVPVLVDPGLERKAFLQCIVDASPVAMIAVPAALGLRRAAPRSFASVQHTVSSRRVPLFGAVLADTTLEEIRAPDTSPFPIATTTEGSEAAIAFTSGSTGIPKGVIYHQGIFRAQVQLFREVFGIQEGEVDLALLYIFALFNPALGVTTVIPDMDPTRSAKVNPAYIVEAIHTHGVTNAFGSPTIWNRVVPYCIEHHIRLPSLRRVLMAGAPVPPSLIEALYTHVLDADARVLTPYGATEALPLTIMDGREILAETARATEAGQGMCVGRPLPGVDVRVIRITDAPIATWEEATPLPAGEIGEIVARGPVVTRAYVNRPEQTALTKIPDGDGLWHRMGDVGYIDNEGRLWFCGRKAHRVETPSGTIFPVRCEAIFNRHPDVTRTAVVGVGDQGRQEPVLIVETPSAQLRGGLLDRQRLVMELLALGSMYDHTRQIQRVLFYPRVFPTDVRHNAKIQREKLAVWATHQLQVKKPATAPATIPDGASPDTSAGPEAPAFTLGRAMRLLSLLVGLVASIGLLLWRRREQRQQGQGNDDAKHSRA